MPGHTITHEVTATAERATTARTTGLTPTRAARELGLKRAEFDLAVHLGRIRTVPDGGGGSRRVDPAEIERLRGRPGFPEGLRESVETVGTTQGAALMDVTKARFTRLARLGMLVPVRFHLNRYRAVVWLYLADELRRFAADDKNAPLLTGCTPESLRSQLDAGIDLRPRNWRNRHLGFMLRLADDPWSRAGAVASLLDPLHVAEVVKDPYDRSYLHRFRQAPPSHGMPGSPAAHLAEELMTAQDPDEIAWLQSDLVRLTDEAQLHRAAPRPAPRLPEPAHETGRESHRRRTGSRRLFGRWLRGGR
ncbi:DUF6397 family protein [Streptomyces sp. 15-116A]|uniref:DUF6397 family protein n=1 Tax=Streptomyces sp. 15-116A TaxID=2259035 RepID=UPI0021B178FD|nr:DUF6397 family protein [Streptomyces sp. 15-116A]MCT7353014.1 DUF6397 family protein [Streptomyces sp. 15-116A]